MKKLVYGFLAMMLLGVGATSCSSDDEGYSLGDYVIAPATYHQLDDYFYLVNDDGESLWPAANQTHISFLEEGDRVTVNYTILGDDPNGDYTYYVRVNGIEQMLTKDMLIFDETTTTQERDSVGSDPVSITSAWIVDDYLTLTFEMPLAYTTQFVNVIEDLTLDKTDDDAVILELTHNYFNAPLSGYSAWGIASFDISALKEQGEDSINIALRARDDSGNAIDYDNRLVYDFSNDNPETASTPNLAKVMKKEQAECR